MDYKFIADLLADVNVPTEGILSRVLQKDEHVNITLFGFSPGQELSTHSAPTPAVLYFLNGEADVTLGDDVHQAKTGSFAYMPPLLPHAIAAKSATMMLLVQIKLPKGQLLRQPEAGGAGFGTTAHQSLETLAEDLVQGIDQCQQCAPQSSRRRLSESHKQ